MDGRHQRRSDARVTGGAYALLFLLGLLEGLIGCFQFGGSAGPVPVAALGLAAFLFVTCLLAGLGMRSTAGALAPAAGWFVVSAVLASVQTGGGSVIVTNTAAGLCYLYGGAIAAVIAIVLAYTFWSRPRAGRQ